jgi:hypothetical protein
LSPTQFGLSVHNAIAGQWSILRGQHGESVAIAGEADTFEHAMVEAATLLQSGARSLLVVIAEERPPAAYDRWIDDVPFSYALALKIGKIQTCAAATNGQHWQLRLEPAGGDVASSEWPHALDFLRNLHEQQHALTHTWKTRRWIWQRVA